MYPVAWSIRNILATERKLMMSSSNSSRVKAPDKPVSLSNLVSNETNDLTAPNSPERVVGDRIEPVTQPKLLKCKTNTIFSTFNVRSLTKNSRKQELSQSFSKQNLDVLSIQEHRSYHPDSEFLHSSLGKNTLITSSAWKNSQGSTIGGIGLLLSPKASSNLLSIKKVSDRIVVAEFNSNPKTSFISCYSPTNVSDETIVNDFYSSLLTTLQQIPTHNFLIVAGDFNAQLGSDKVNFSFHHETNRNGQKLADLILQCELFASNTIFMKNLKKLWTFQSPNGSKSQIDFILVRSKWKNSVRDSQAYSSFSSVGSDHRIVSAKITLSLRSSKKCKPNPMKLIDWQQIHNNSEMSSAYAIEVRNRYDLLSLPDDDIETKYEKLVNANKHVCLTFLPKKKKNKHKPYYDDDLVKNARKIYESAKLKHEARATRRSAKALAEAQKVLDDAYLTTEALFIEGKVNSIKNFHSSKQYSSCWKIINDISGNKDHPSIQLRGGSAENRKENWLKHFQGLLGKPPTVNPEPLPLSRITEELAIPIGCFTLEELNKTLKSFSKNKSSGLDQIPTVLWKDPNFSEILLEFCNHTFDSHTPPSAWLTGGIIPVPKKGDLTLPSNYRGITLMPIAAKVYNKLILNRLTPYIDPLLRKNQNGFRKGRGTLSQILSIRRILEEMRKLNKEAIISFVDFRKAFDSVSREKMFEILPLYGIPDKIVSAIRALYTSTKAKVVSPDGDTALFDIQAGVLQGDTLAPFLFILVLDYVLRISVDTINNKGIKIKSKLGSRNSALHLTDLDFADDLALISENIQNASELLHALEKAASQVGLFCNEGKTEFLSSTGQDYTLRSLNNVNLKKVDDFKYLGSYINDSEQDFNVRKALAWKACNRLNKLWRSSLPNSLKVKTFRTLVEPILLYGSETWTMTRAMEHKIDGCYTNLLKRVQNLYWAEHPTLAQIYNGLPRISSTLSSRRLRFSGHCFRAKEEIISSLLLWSPIGPIRSRKFTYIDTLKRETKLEIEELKTAMQDRELWRERYV